MNLRKLAPVALALTGVLMLGSFGATASAQKKKPVVKAAAASGNVEAGKKVYTTNGCKGCHVVGKEGGKTGPDLSHVGKTGTAAKLSKYIRDPKSVNKAAKMPAYPASKISDADMKNLTAYLLSLK